MFIGIVASNHNSIGDSVMVVRGTVIVSYGPFTPLEMASFSLSVVELIQCRQISDGDCCRRLGRHQASIFSYMIRIASIKCNDFETHNNNVSGRCVIIAYMVFA